ncbi:MAG TPA: DUF6298 domain-containing protein [Verrucomicrobiaceae bacterium]|jgi:hypothetical protein
MRGAIPLAGLILVVSGSFETSTADALQLDPQNPHYFLFHGKPAMLITSGEHYGAVLNLDFDYAKYLQTLEKHGFNLTRTFTGAAYLEPAGSFKIAGNTLAPQAGRYLAPWKRSDQSGAWDGGNKWDLTGWNEEYFARFRNFVREASDRGIIVEVNLFCPFYEDKETKQSKMWPLSPFHASNNVNGLGSVSSHDIYTLDKHGGLLAPQERFVRRIVMELKDFDNVYYEICNEPYFGGVTMEWQHHIADVIEDAQMTHPAKKLISQNIANHSAKIERPHPAVSIFNFHYTYPPVAVAENLGRNTVIGENETGFRGTADEVYRNEAWDFLLAGGGIFNNLDYSFTAGHEDGTFEYPATQPGGGGANFRAQLAVLVKFMNGFDFVRTKPADEMLRNVSPGVSIHVLANRGKLYAAYLHHSARPGWKDSKKLNSGNFRDAFELEVPAGNYEWEWIEPASGRVIEEGRAKADNSRIRLETPTYSQDMAFWMREALHAN